MANRMISVNLFVAPDKKLMAADEAPSFAMEVAIVAAAVPNAAILPRVFGVVSLHFLMNSSIFGLFSVNSFFQSCCHCSLHDLSTFCPLLFAIHSFKSSLNMNDLTASSVVKFGLHALLKKLKRPFVAGVSTTEASSEAGSEAGAVGAARESAVAGESAAVGAAATTGLFFDFIFSICSVVILSIFGSFLYFSKFFVNVFKFSLSSAVSFCNCCFCCFCCSCFNFVSIDSTFLSSSSVVIESFFSSIDFKILFILFKSFSPASSVLSVRPDRFNNDCNSSSSGL